MTDRIEICVRGEPKATPRLRGRSVQRRGKAAFVHLYTPDTADGWKLAIAAELLGKVPTSPWTGPVSLSVQVYFQRPQRLCRRSSPSGSVPHAAKPDVDNLVKAIMDAMTKCGVWRDDAQVHSLSISKMYAALGYSPGARILAMHQPPTQLPLDAGKEHP